MYVSSCERCGRHNVMYIPVSRTAPPTQEPTQLSVKPVAQPSSKNNSYFLFHAKIISSYDNVRGSANEITETPMWSTV